DSVRKQTIFRGDTCRYARGARRCTTGANTGHHLVSPEPAGGADRGRKLLAARSDRVRKRWSGRRRKRRDRVRRAAHHRTQVRQHRGSGLGEEDRHGWLHRPGCRARAGDHPRRGARLVRGSTRRGLALGAGRARRGRAGGPALDGDQLRAGRGPGAGPDHRDVLGDDRRRVRQAVGDRPDGRPAGRVRRLRRPVAGPDADYRARARPGGAGERTGLRGRGAACPGPRRASGVRRRIRGGRPDRRGGKLLPLRPPGRPGALPRIPRLQAARRGRRARRRFLLRHDQRRAVEPGRRRRPDLDRQLAGRARGAGGGARVRTTRCRARGARPLPGVLRAPRRRALVQHGAEPAVPARRAGAAACRGRRRRSGHRRGLRRM
ncbi:MAG: ABC-type Fe3+-siderophore transport system, periplasmic iron-binding component, partial [uncultured Rubrobacteraceae bacterium]